MDYGASIHEADDPAGASPWVNSPVSSPQQNRSGFDNTSGEQPTFPYSTQASNGLEQVVEAESFGRAAKADVGSGTVRETEGSGPLPPAASQSSATSHPRSSDIPAGSVSAPPQQEQVAGPRAQPDQPQQPQKPSQPQLKLQAKITGLERTGKKDPVLRFDIHVLGRWALPFLVIWGLTSCRQTYPVFAQPNTETFDAFTPSLSNWPLT